MKWSDILCLWISEKRRYNYLPLPSSLILCSQVASRCMWSSRNFEQNCFTTHTTVYLFYNLVSRFFLVGLIILNCFSLVLLSIFSSPETEHIITISPTISSTRPLSWGTIWNKFLRALKRRTVLFSQCS